MPTFSSPSRVSPRARFVLFVCACAALLLPLLTTAPILAHADDTNTLPPGLESWIPWVKNNDAMFVCPLLGGERICVWPGVITLELGTTGGSFRSSVVLDRKGEVTLPGDASAWPLDVTVEQGSNRDPAVVLLRSSSPTIVLAPGRYAISGRFAWTSLPKSLRVPNSAGVVHLTVGGKRIAYPKLSQNGELWLQNDQSSEAAEEDALQIQVSRLLADGIPFHLKTDLKLTVSGKAREISLGNVLPKGFQPVSLSSPLAYKIDPKWNLTLQVKPGEYHVLVDAVQGVPPSNISPTRSSAEGWPEEEVWAFQPDENVRSVEITGAVGIDPNRTELPEEWRQLAAYVLPKDSALEIKETRRGLKDATPNRLHLQRDVWLDLSGSGATVRDQLSGLMSGGWRLNMSPGTSLTRVSSGGADQLITSDVQSALSGVEVRTQNVQLEAISRLDQGAGSFPAVGWDHDVDSLIMNLNLGPGWTLFEASGVDLAQGTWLSSWRLWDIFFVCLMAVASGKLLGKRYGVLMFVTLLVCHDQVGAPRYLWLLLLGGKALIEQVPVGRFRNVVLVVYGLLFGLLASVILPFSIDQVRMGLFPQLTPSFNPAEFLIMVLGPLLGLGVGASFIAVILLFFRRQYRDGFWTFILAGGLLLATGFVFALGRTGFLYKSGEDYAQRTSVPASAPTELGEGYYDRRGETYSNLSSSAEVTGKSKTALRQELVQLDPKAVVQTGASVPEWHWRSWRLSWNGPVEKGRMLTLYLLSPSVNRVLSFLRVALLVGLSLSFLSLPAIRSSLGRLLPVALSLLALLVIPCTGTAQAEDFPSESLLQQLRSRLEADICKSDCTVTQRIDLVVDGDELQMAAIVASQGAGAWAVPGPIEQFSPTVVQLDQQAVSEFRRTSDGLAWIRVPAGVHEVRLKGSLSGRTLLTLQFGLLPRHMSVTAPGWKVDGVSPEGEVGETLQLIRNQEAGARELSAGNSESEELPLAHWYLVRRELSLALPWTVRTEVERLGNAARAEIVRIPLLKGESITGGEAKEESRSAIATFPRDAATLSWSSSLSEEPTLELQALSTGSVSETWIVRCSAIWHCEFEGINPVRMIENGESSGVWVPWPGEQLVVEVRKPLGVSGTTETIEQTVLTWEPGSGLLKGSLALQIRSSQGGWRKIKLPVGATLEELQLNGQVRPAALEEGQLALPLSPGKQSYLVKWRQSWETGAIQTFPEVDLGAQSGNATVVVVMPAKRWLLLVSGPAWGPAILFWGALLVVALFAVLLGKLKIPPLSTSQWILLGLGMATLHPAFLLLPAFCCSLLHLRSTWLPEQRLKFNLLQTFTVLVCLVTLLVLCASIYFGLIIDPDMGVTGNQSTNSVLRWFVDLSPGRLPQPTVYSAPLWVWRILMLLWSCWLVFAILKWIKWGWGCLNTGGIWK